MILGCIADDFTGAGDLASILTGQGMRTSLLTSIGDIESARADAGVVALKTRSVAPADAIRQSLEALSALRGAGCEQFYFKYCSTFDSTREGNIGPVAEALLRELGATKAIVCPAFPANGRTVFQGHLFVGDTLLAESSMRDHPITPMTDSDIRRWLSHQCTGAVSHVPHRIVAMGTEAIARALDAVPHGLIVCDAIADGDLRAIGYAAKDMALITGGSALALGLPDNLRYGFRGSLRPGARVGRKLFSRDECASGALQKNQSCFCDRWRRATGGLSRSRIC
jgi:3-dehydrotetronate 4-kinase